MATKAQMAVEMDALRHKVAQLEADRALLRAKVDELTRIADAKRESAPVPASRPAAPAASRASAPAGWHVLVLNGTECFASRDYGYLSRVARNTKLGQPSLKVEVRRVH